MLQMGNVFEEVALKGRCDDSNVFAGFLLNKGLYDSIAISEENIEDLMTLTAGKVKISAFCPDCGEMRVFTVEPVSFYVYNDMKQAYSEHLLGEDLASLQNRGFGRSVINEEGSTEQQWDWKNWQCKDAARLIVLSFVCAMNEDHRIDFIVLTDEYSMRKIGQYPSVADLAFPELKQFQKELTKENLKELRRAIGLYSQGIGIGAYVYLRRIIERLIATASQRAIEDGRLTIEEYERERVADRIKQLKGYLPTVLVENRVIYGILSKGVHELSEEECIEYFPVVKSCIMMILNMWEQQRRQQEEEKKMAAALSNIATTIL